MAASLTTESAYGDRASVAVVGGGIIGAACARWLADAGCRVRVIDKGVGRAAGSFAAAGLLLWGEGRTEPPAWHALARRSMALWPQIASAHPEIELQRLGLLLIGDDPELVAWREREGLATERTEWAGRPALFLPEVEGLRPQRVPAALLGDLPVERRDVLDLAELRASHDVVVVAGGAWSTPLLAQLGVTLEVVPRRGQMAIFSRGDLPHAVYEHDGEHLAVPRADGRVLVGTTLEHAGFDACTVPETIDAMEAWARRVVPGLGAREDEWAGLRPDPRRDLPIIGWIADGVIAATGHFRNGILLAPATAEMVRDLVVGDRPKIDPGDVGPPPID